MATFLGLSAVIIFLNHLHLSVSSAGLLKIYKLHIYESAGSYISKLLAKLICLPNSKPPGNQVRLENLHESVQCIMWGEGHKKKY